jgi:hypothetical protein
MFQFLRSTAPLVRNARNATFSSKSKGPTAVVLLNMGGPAEQNEVGDFLQRLS